MKQLTAFPWQLNVSEKSLFIFHTLMIFVVVRPTGITHENIVQEAKKYWSTAASLQGAQVRLRKSWPSQVYCMDFNHPNVK